MGKGCGMSAVKGPEIVIGKKPDGLHSGPLVWVKLGIMCFFSIFQFLLQGSIGVFAEGMKQSFQADAAAIGLLSSSFFCSYIVMQIPAGVLYDRFGVRLVAGIAVLIMLFGCLLLSGAQDLEAAMVSRVLLGFGCSCGFIGMLFGIKQWFPVGQFPLLVALSECVSMAGVGLANHVLSRSFESFGWRYSMLGCAVIALVLMVAILKFVSHDDFDAEGCANVACAEGQPTTEGSAGSALRPWKVGGGLPAWHVLKIREVWVGGLFSAGLFSILSVFVALWAIPFLKSAYSLDVVSATSLASSVYIGVAVSSPLVGWVAARISLSILMSFGAAGSAALMFLILSVPDVSLAQLHGLMFLSGFFCAVYQFSFALVGQQAPRGLEGTAMGMTNMLVMIVALILQPAIGFIISSSSGVVLDGYETYGTRVYQEALGILPWFMVLAFILSFFLRDRGISGFQLLNNCIRRTFRKACGVMLE